MRGQFKPGSAYTQSAIPSAQTDIQWRWGSWDSGRLFIWFAVRKHSHSEQFFNRSNRCGGHKREFWVAVKSTFIPSAALSLNGDALSNNLIAVPITNYPHYDF